MISWDRKLSEGKKERLPFKHIERDIRAIKKMKHVPGGRFAVLPLIGYQLIHLGIVLIRMSMTEEKRTIKK